MEKTAYLNRQAGLIQRRSRELKQLVVKGEGIHRIYYKAFALKMDVLEFLKIAEEIGRLEGL